MLFDAVYGSLPTALMVVQHEDLKICYINPLMGKVLGERGNLAGKTVGEAFRTAAGDELTREALDFQTDSNNGHVIKVRSASGSNLELCISTSQIEQNQFFLIHAREPQSQPSSKDSRLAFALHEACDGLWDWNAQTNEVYFSPKLDQMLGFEPGEREPSFSGWYDLVHKQDADKVVDALKQHMAGDSEFYDVEYRISTKQGEIKQVRDRGRVSEWDEEGNPIRVVGMLSDITDFRQMEKELCLARDRFEDFARCGSDWFWETDDQFRVSEVSVQFTLQTGVSFGEVHDCNLMKVFQDEGLEDAARAITNRLPIRCIRIPIGNTQYWVELSGRPVFDENGEFHGYRGIGENVHDKVMLEQKLKAYRQNAETMMDRAPVAISLTEENGQFYYANDSFLKLLRADRDNLTEKYKQEKQLSRPDKSVFQSDESQSYEMVLETLDGPRFYSVLKYGLNRADDAEKVVVNMVMDITYTRQQEVEQKKIEMVLNNIAEGIVITDADHRIVSVNKSLQDVTGYTADELIGNTPGMLSSGRYDRSFYQDMWNEVRLSGKWRGEIWNRCRNGAVIRQHVSIQAIVINGQIQHYLGIYSPHSQLSSARDAEMFARQNDPLTGLPNRELFQDRLYMACQRVRVHHHPLDITIIRVTNLVALNERSGHIAGDQVLKRFAYQLQDILALDDTVSRSGLDEFIILREGQNREALTDTIEGIFQQPVVLASGERIQAHFVMARAVYPDDGSNASRLMRHLRRKVALE